MINRILNLDNAYDDSTFVWGARQVGKTTLIKETYPDAVIGDGRVAIEIKSVEEIQSRHTKGLKAFQEEFPDCCLIAVSFDSRPRITNDVEVCPVNDFLKKLWNHEIV